MIDDDPYGAIQKLLTELPGSAWPIVKKSREFRRNGDIDLARMLLKRAIAQHDAPKLLAEYADLLLGLGDLDEALDVAFRAILADPLNGEAQVVLSRVLLDGLPDAFVYLVEVSRLYADEEEPAFAEQLIRRAVERHPKNVALRLHLARFYGEYARTEEAMAELQAALDLNPESAEAHTMMATAMLEDGNLAAAQSWVDRARTLGADSDLVNSVQNRIREVVRRTT